jgi:formylglycine-generating enzyme required for sulfatase activity
MKQKGAQSVLFTVRLCALLLSVGLASFLPGRGYADVVIDLTYIGAPGNSDENPVGELWVGGVDYGYYIGTYEVTVAQYAEFLNSVAASDPYGLYNDSMGTGGPLGTPIITRTGEDGAYTYTAVTGREYQPVRYVDFYDSLRFCNWLNNGQVSGTTETGAYTLALGLWVEREPGATWVLPSEDEWYKAAYYDPVNGVYYDYPNGSDTAPQEPTDETTPRELNFGDDPYWQGGVYYTSAGDTTGSSSFGVADMGGNVVEWNESLANPIQGPQRVTRGGDFMSPASDMASASQGGYLPTAEASFIGFRVAYIIPEPSTLMLILFGLPAVFVAGARRSGCVGRKR